MKIAFIVGEFPSLSQTFILNQINGLLDMGYDVDIFTRCNPAENKVHPDIEKHDLTGRVYYFDIPKTKIGRVLKAAYLVILNFHKYPGKILRALNIFKYGRCALSLELVYVLIPFSDRKFDIIYCHFGPNGIFGAYLKEIGITHKTITTFHGQDMSGFIAMHGSNVYKNLFLNGDLFLPISDYWKQRLIKLNCDEKRIMIHRMGIDLNKFKYIERKSKPGEIITILTLGRLVEKKGHKYAIKAIERATKKYKNISYIIAGDGYLRNKLEYLVSELEIEDFVKFVGTVDQREALSLYRRAHIFVLPCVTAIDGDKEGIPVVLMEAQATGLPVISTYHSGIPEVVVESKCGFLVPEKDAGALAEKIEYLIEHPEIWSEMGRYGRQIVEEEYDIKKLNKNLVNIYHNLLGNNK